MALAVLSSFLRRHRRIAIDTCVFLYQLEAVSGYVSLTHPIFEWLERPEHSAVTSAITMTELLIAPYRRHQSLASQFRASVYAFPHLEWIDVSVSIADLAARLRAEHRLATMDALQAATAIHSGAGGLVTNDAAFRRVLSFETLLLDEAMSS